MSIQISSLRNHESRWVWPVDITKYDRNPTLSEEEQAELTLRLSSFEGKQSQIRKTTRALLSRLLRPIDDVLTYINATPRTYYDTVRILSLEMHRRGTTFWGWSIEEWVESICPNRAAFMQRYGSHRDPSSYDNRARPFLPIFAYLLGSSDDISPLLELIDLHPFAQKIFGKEIVDQVVQQLWAVLQGWGYQRKDRQSFAGCVCYLLLHHQSPHLEDFQADVLELSAQHCTIFCVRDQIFQVSRALYALGKITHSLSGLRKISSTSSLDGSITDEWLSWCERWRKQSTLQSRDSTYYQLLKTGRWLKVSHPEVVSPSQWTYELAAEFVAAVNEMNVGEWSSAQHRGCIRADLIGKPLRPNAKSKLFSAMRTFLRDCQEWGWIPVRFNPHRALATPRSIRNLIGPDPRVVDKDLWAKILWAAMNLDTNDLPRPGRTKRLPSYPLEMVRAVAMVWCFAALRSEEILRLRLGCIRWQHEDVMIPETGEVLPKDAVCFLDIPVNKTTTAHTKAVHPLVGKRINEWECVRPKEQLRGLDRKTSEQVKFLFSYRGKRISKQYINESLIPLLCRKAGIPEQDSRGQITSHRARATIASMLYNAKEPLSAFEIKEYLGHKYLSSTQHYLLVDQTKLASKVEKAGYLDQNLATIEVLLDQEAVLNGAAARGEVWKYYDLGHGFCTNTFWADCKHRMACARCPFYRPKNTNKEQLIEGKANLVRMLEYVKLSEDEKLLVTEGIELHQALIEKLADTPTPAGPTPRELEQKKMIPLKLVQLSKRKKLDEQQAQSSQEEDE